MEDVFINGEFKRCGFTTGSCAAAAAKAATLYLLRGEMPEFIEIETPSGIDLKLEVLDYSRVVENSKVVSASCCVIKDGGDDPDVTTGASIYATCERNSCFEIDGGVGVGRHRETSFLGKKGEAAINKVPREMIKKEVEKIAGENPKLRITISVPNGEKIALNTMNRMIGVEDGISIIGTSGIVKPMSSDAIIKTFCLEMDLHFEKFGKEEIFITPGNYGFDYLKRKNPNIKPILISNYIGEAFSYLDKQGVSKVNLVGHIGKLSKLACGIYNTHSKYADTRMVSFVYFLSLMGADRRIIEKVNTMLTAEDAYIFCRDCGYGKIIHIMEEACVKNLKKYLKNTSMEIEVEIYIMEKND